MKRIALCSIASLVALSGSSRTASASGYYISWSRHEATPAAAAPKTERTSSGYYISWSKAARTERASSGYMLSWGKAQPAD